MKMMSDPDTMAYNAPWFPPAGCIPEPENEWQNIMSFWMGCEEKRFYAFLQRTSDGAFVGDVNYHYNPERDWYDMGIVIYAPERGKGYGKQGLRLLLDRAFRVNGISRLCNEFETSRDAAYAIHKAVGFKESEAKDGMVRLEIKKEDYLSGCRGEDAMNKTFIEMKLFQVKPDKLGQFEKKIEEMSAHQLKCEGCISLKYFKRFYTIDGIELGEPPRELTKIVKCVKYYSYWEFDTKENYGKAIKTFFDNYNKDLQKLLIAPFDINLGYSL